MVADTNLCSPNSIRRPGRGADVDPVLRFEGASHPAVRRGYVRGVERQLALRLSRSNELLELGGFCPHA